MARETIATLTARLEEKEIQIQNLREFRTELRNENDKLRRSISDQSDTITMLHTALQRLYGFICARLDKVDHTVEGWMAQSRGESYYNPDQGTQY